MFRDVELDSDENPLVLANEDDWLNGLTICTRGPQAEWRWRIGLSVREPSGELVLQMTNVAPWGEETRAVRMICTRR